VRFSAPLQIHIKIDNGQTIMKENSHCMKTKKRLNNGQPNIECLKSSEDRTAGYCAFAGILINK
jgi:hypothetical protein